MSLTPRIGVLACVLLSGTSFGSGFAIPTRADSIRADSVRTAGLRDSVMQAKAEIRSRYLRFPATVESLSTAARLSPYHLFGSDDGGISEVLRACPKVVTAPFALASGYNRALLYGYPVGFVGSRLDPRRWGLEFSDQSGTDLTTPGDIAWGSLRMPEGLRYTSHPMRLVSPEVAIFWENGVFNENTLNVRIARPLGRSLDMGLVSNYRHFAGERYSHGNGNVYDFYAGMVSEKDTALLAREGRNPLTNEQTVQGRLRWTGQIAGAEVRYRYVDAQNDLVDQNDSAVELQGYGPLEWERVHRWVNDLGFSMERARFGFINLDGSFALSTVGHRVSPFSRTIPGQRGEERGWGIGLTPSTNLGPDTLAVVYELWNVDRTLYTGQLWQTSQSKITCRLRHRFSLGSVDGGLEGAVGQAFLVHDRARANVWLWNAALDVAAGAHTLRLFGASDAAAYAMPYDPTRAIPGTLWDAYGVTGAEALFQWDHFGGLVAYTYAWDVDSSTLSASWPNGAIPYACPGSVLTVAPMLGRLHGFLLSTRWMLSDVQPYVKAQALVSHEVAVIGGRAHIRSDLVLDYWSKRGTIRYGSADQWGSWNREIYDLSLHTAVQISSFRLFYKVDNLLGRRIAYVPGYYLPGLTFRWGFGWLIPE